MTAIKYIQGPAQPTPEQRLYLMNDDEWELFIEECVEQLMHEKNYIQVARIGGAGDKGRDVVGYKENTAKLETWDLYQAKHYNETLSPSEFYPELAKFLYFLSNGDYTKPKNYFICALKIGPQLHDLVMNPEKLKNWTKNEIEKEKTKKKAAIFTTNSTEKVLEYINTFDFSTIRIKTAAELIKIHSRSSKHWARFGHLPLREQNPSIPEQPTTNEQNYIKALLIVYEELIKKPITNTELIPENRKNHFKMQRRLFYSAEGLNRFSRDKLPGAFDDLLDQVELGVGNTIESDHPDGMSKLKETLAVANTLQLSSNPLSSRLEAGDLQGSCHHLANQNRILWATNDTKCI